MPGPLDLDALAGSVGSCAAELDELWRMLGLPRPEGGFTAGDLALLSLLLELVDDLGGDHDLAASLARSLGHHTARLATWQGLELVDVVQQALPPEAATDRLAELGEKGLPTLDRLLVAVWRRHLTGVLRWRSGRAEEEVHRLGLTVGFVDMVGWTTLSAALDGRTVSSLVRTFERLCVDVVNGRGGRVVKTLGDEVLFVADEPVTGVCIALDVATRISEEVDLPDVRVGVATGDVAAAFGDVHGPTVNLAHRLTKGAEPGSVLTDAATAEAVGPRPGVVLRPAGPRVLRGFGTVETWHVGPEGP